MSLLEIGFEGSSDIGAASLHVVGHLVESQPIVVILQLPEGLETAIEVVVDDGKAVAVAVKSLPTREIEVLRVVGQVQAALEHVLAPHRREGVEVHADDEVGVVGHEGRELVVNRLLVELDLVKLRKLKVEVVVLGVEERRTVGSPIDGTVGLDEGRTGEEVGGLVILLHGDVEVADDPLVALKLEVGPLLLVDKLLQRLLEVLEDGGVRTLHLVVVDGDLRLEFLGVDWRRPQYEGEAEEADRCQYDSFHDPFLI